MKKLLALGLFIFVLLAGAIAFAPRTYAAGPQWVVVNPGDTLYSIAVANGVSVQELMQANNLPNANFVYSGQRLLIPAPGMAINLPAAQYPAQAQAPSAPSQPQASIYYTVRPGDSLAAIAARYGVPVAAIAGANGLTDWNFVWYGQRLRIPGATNLNGLQPSAPPAAAQPPAQAQNQAPAQQPALNAPAASNAPTGGKWIDVNLSKQTITAYEGNTPLKTILVSTGTAYHPTVVGTFHIQTKYPAVRMTGGTPGVDYYDLPNVPWTMFFYQGYAIHGTYWHNNFGHRMSHGCVNLPTPEAKWFYDWAPVGTPVVTHM